MKKETINTFDKGMVKDLHPLTTPNSVLTDALNATLVTYNGNDMVLQNDMGNAKVGTAFLPAGYVPVGMKEHGGIIYVAAWNPETKKGQIGSFPSPKQLWENEGWSVNSDNNPSIDTVSLDTNSFYTGYMISTETIKEQLFKFQDGTMREFHPGDKYAVAVDSSTYNTLVTYVSEGKIKLQLGVVKKDGSIEIMADAKDDMFLFPIDNSHADASAYITSNTPRVFNASSSGSLIIIVTIITLDSFELLRDYDLINNTQVQVTFTGRGTQDDKVLETSGNTLKLFNGKTSSKNNSSITLSGSTGSQSFDIYPHLPYGIIQRMRRQGIINFDRIKKSQGDFHEWRFFVTNDYIKIGWAYEFYNLGNKKELEGIIMSFYDIIKPATYPSSPDESITFQKEIYSGNFEDYIRFDEHPNIKKNHIYIVHIARKVKGEPIPEFITHKMLYVSKLYNDQYNSVYRDSNGNDIPLNFSQCVEFTAKEETVYIDIEADTTIEKQGYTKATIKFDDTTEASNIDITAVKDNYYYKAVNANNPEIETSVHQHQYLTELKNEYNCDLEVKPTYTDSLQDIIGIPNPSNLQDVASNTLIQGEIRKDEDSWRNIATENVYPNISITSSSPQVSIISTTNGIRKANILIEDYRYMQGLSTSLMSSTYDSLDYLPLLAPDYSNEEKRRIFSCHSRENMLIVCGNAHGVYSNSKLNATTVTEGNQVSEDGRTGLTAAAQALNEAYPPMVTMFAGLGPGSGCTYTTERPGRRIINNWIPKIVGERDENNHVIEAGEGTYVTGAVDTEGDWLGAVWKMTDNQHEMVDLFTKRTWEASSNAKWPRLDIMLRCFLSQIFIAQRTKRKLSYITTDKDYYRYQDTKSTLILEFLNNSSIVYTDIMTPYDTVSYSSDNFPISTITSLQDLYNYWKTNVLPSEQNDLTNLIPTINAQIINSTITKEVELDNDFGINNLLRFYFGISKSTSPDDISDVDPKIIKVVDYSKTAQNANASRYKKTINNVSTPVPGDDGTFEWIYTPPLKDAGPMSEDYTQDTCDTIYDWQGKRWIMAFSLNRMFVTRGAYEGWYTISEGNYNELLGNSELHNRFNFFKKGKGVHANDIVPGSNDGTYNDWWSWGSYKYLGLPTFSGPFALDADAPNLHWAVLMSNKSLYHYKATSDSNKGNEIDYGYSSNMPNTLDDEVPTE